MNTKELFTKAGYTIDEIGLVNFDGHEIDTDEVEITTDTLEDFRTGSHGWAAAALTTDTPNLLIFENVQPKPGDYRRTVIVFDLGEVRGVSQ